MNKTKSTLVTIIIAVMLAVITAGLYKLFLPGFIAITGTLAAYGFFHSASDFNRWLRKEPPLTVAELPGGRPETFYDWEKDTEIAPVNLAQADPLPKQTAEEINQAVTEIIEEMKNSPAGA